MALSAAISGCGPGTPAVRTINVPRDAPTIQAGVTRARPGDLVMIEPGVYHEKVLIETDRIVVRGRDRNTVIVDGEYQRESGFTVAANGVAIENLTVRRFNANGVFINGAYSPKGVDPAKTFGQGNDVLKGYRVSYVTAYNNGLYGVYAFAARGGQIDHSYASGQPDSGLYVGQCKPCNVLVTDVIAERNSIGYFGTNASGGVFVVRSTFRNNRLGVMPNSQKTERLAPQSETVMAGNSIVDNNDPNAPNHPRGAFGLGVVIGGGTKNQLVRNRISGNTGAGVLVTDLDDYLAENNRVEGNVLTSNGIDLYYDAPTDGRTLGNCFVGNTFATSVPVTIEQALPCAGTAAPVGSSRYRQANAPKGPNFKDVQEPPAQPNMPEVDGPPRPMSERVPNVDLASIDVPSA